jgi:hypothetical protein
LNALDTGAALPAKIPEDIRRGLPALVAEAEAQLEPLTGDALQAELTGLVAAMGMGLPQAEKTEFMAAAMVLLEKFPAGLCREALHDSIEQCDSLRKVIPHIKAYCEDYPDRMRRRLERLQNLQSFASGTAGV